MSLISYIEAMPKTDLHVHLEGAIQAETLLTLAQRNGVAFPVATIAEVRDWFAYRDFEHFRLVYRTCAHCAVTSDDYELLTYDLGQKLARQNARYAEVRFGPASPHLRGIAQETYMDGLGRGRRRVLEDFGVELAWVFELGRGPFQGPETWEYATAVAVAGMSAGVVALGLAGPEYRHTAETFAPWFDRARALGLHSAPHAGELAGPESVWGALQVLGAERIGHGVRSIEDRTLVAHLAGSGVALEVCPHSNIALGIYASLAQHPVRQLHDAGVVLTINSDDPSLFHASLAENLATLVDPLDFDVAAINEIVLNGVRKSFLPPHRRQAMEERFQREMQALMGVHLGVTSAK